MRRRPVRAAVVLVPRRPRNAAPPGTTRSGWGQHQPRRWLRHSVQSALSPASRASPPPTLTTVGTPRRRPRRPGAGRRAQPRALRRARPQLHGSSTSARPRRSSGLPRQEGPRAQRDHGRIAPDARAHPPGPRPRSGAPAPRPGTQAIASISSAASCSASSAYEPCHASRANSAFAGRPSAVAHVSLRPAARWPSMRCTSAVIANSSAATLHEPLRKGTAGRSPRGSCAAHRYRPARRPAAGRGRSGRWPPLGPRRSG